MLMIKQGVRVALLTPTIWAAAHIATAIWEKFELDCVITSGSEGKHKRGSAHYIGNAIDLRTRDFVNGGAIEVAAGLLSKALGSEYQVIIEGNHMHIEFDPQVHY